MSYKERTIQIELVYDISEGIITPAEEVKKIVFNELKDTELFNTEGVIDYNIYVFEDNE